MKVESSTDSQEQIDAANSVLSNEENENNQSKSKVDEESESLENDNDEKELEDEDESQESESEDESKEEKKPKLKGYKKKLFQKDQKIADLERRLADIERGSKKAPDQSKNAELSDDKEPDIDDFETYAEYQKALVRWEIKQDKKEEAKKAAKEQLEDASKKAQKRFRDQYLAFSEKVDDLEEVLEQVSDVELNPAMQAAIADTDVAPEILYHLAKNREELERINGLSPIKMVREIGKLELKLEGEAKKDDKSDDDETPKKEIKKSRASEPITPLSAKRGTTQPKDLSDPNLSFAEYERIRSQQIAKKEARR